MKTLTTGEWVAVTLAVLIVLSFFVFSGVFQNTMPGSTTSTDVTERQNDTTVAGDALTEERATESGTTPEDNPFAQEG